MIDKTIMAKEVISKCRSSEGYFASADIYWGQYWLRDGAASLGGLEDKKPAARQLETFGALQRKSGELPAIIYTPKSIFKIVPAGLKLIKENPFLLKPVIEDLKFMVSGEKEKDSNESRYVFRNKPGSVVGFQRWAGDSELFFVILIRELAKEGLISLKSYGEGVEKAVRFIEARQNMFWLIQGGGWMDAMKNYKGAIAFHANLLLYRMYSLLGKTSEANAISNTLNSALFYNENFGYYKSRPFEPVFDTLSHALAIKWGLIPANRIEMAVKNLEKVFTKFGCRNINPAYGYKDCEQPPYRYQNSACWPFVDAKVIIALKDLGFDEMAKKRFLVLSDQKGFNEWYNPFTGEPKGSKDQLWSAAGYLEAKSVF
ncbi:MAG: hypothetical protein HYW70_01565 [Candidatus Nealsonbacteria bacterium]|nr:hypothetical protein [Candidatus Nealsonbacteria bacterium]